MRKMIITGATLALMCGTALAQNSTDPSAKGAHKAGTHSGTMHRSANNRSMGTTTGQARGGMSNGTAHDSNSLAGTGSSTSGAGAGGAPGSVGTPGS